MKQNILLISLLFCVTFAFAQVNSNHHSVKGYTRKDGTYVPPHTRTNRNETKNDNYTTKGNVNPWTGVPGTLNGGTNNNSVPQNSNNTNYNNSNNNNYQRTEYPYSYYSNNSFESGREYAIENYKTSSLNFWVPLTVTSFDLTAGASATLAIDLFPPNSNISNNYNFNKGYRRKAFGKKILTTLAGFAVGALVNQLYGEELNSIFKPSKDPYQYQQ